MADREASITWLKANRRLDKNQTDKGAMLSVARYMHEALELSTKFEGGKFW
jgi:hypothetical protein